MKMPLLFENTDVNATVWMAIVFVAVWLVVKGVMLLVRKLGRYRWKEWIDAGLDAVDGPLLLGLPAVAVLASVPATRFQQTAVEAIRHGTTVAVIVSLGWLTVAVTLVARRVVERRYRMEVEDNRKARAVNTKFRVLTRVLVLLVVVVTTGAVLTTFPGIRAIGAGLLASAGVAGLVIGLAARPFVETALASIQIALTAPINLDDVLIVEGEWGRVEEIRATYVVVRIWDDRRLIVPLNLLPEPAISELDAAHRRHHRCRRRHRRLPNARRRRPRSATAGHREPSQVGPTVLERPNHRCRCARHDSPGALHRSRCLKGMGLALRHTRSADRLAEYESSRLSTARARRVRESGWGRIGRAVRLVSGERLHHLGQLQSHALDAVVTPRR